MSFWCIDRRINSKKYKKGNVSWGRWWFTFRVLVIYLNLTGHHFVSLLQWRIIAGGTKCIPKSELPVEDEDAQSQPGAPPNSCLWLHPSDLSIALSASTPLYPPGKIIHVVHNHPPEMWWEVFLELGVNSNTCATFSYALSMSFEHASKVMETVKNKNGW